VEGSVFVGLVVKVVWLAVLQTSFDFRSKVFVETSFVGNVPFAFRKPVPSDQVIRDPDEIAIVFAQFRSCLDSVRCVPVS
jgi:hypothetical protein